jgi:flagellar motor switch protein FliN/FliY
MSLHEELLATDQIAVAFATALHALRGDAPALTPQPAANAVPDPFSNDDVRGAAATFRSESGVTGSVVVFVVASLADALEAAGGDEDFVGVISPALVASAHAIGSLAGVPCATEPAVSYERDALPTSAQLAAYPVLEGDAPVACLVVHVASEPDGAEAAGTEQALAGSPLIDSFTGDVLGDVEMGVTAELGRARMSVRELLSISPGAVIDLDRAAGEPVDVLVNGKLIARGEVVIVDEEFGIRISEILKQGTPH